MERSWPLVVFLVVILALSTRCHHLVDVACSWSAARRWDSLATSTYCQLMVVMLAPIGCLLLFAICRPFALATAGYPLCSSRGGALDSRHRPGQTNVLELGQGHGRARDFASVWLLARPGTGQD